MISATLALLGFFVALYLWMWKIGVVGSIACGTGGCEVVQLSEYAEAFGVPVAFYGVVGYLAMFVVSLVGLQPRWVNSKQPSVALLVLSGAGVVYSAYLTYLEAASDSLRIAHTTWARRNTAHSGNSTCSSRGVPTG